MTEPSNAPWWEPEVPAGSLEGAPSYRYPPGPYPGAYPPPPPQPNSGFTPPVTGPRNKLGIASLVLAILALVTVWSFIGGIFLGGAAVVMGLAARGRVKRGEANNGGVAIASIVLGSVAMIIDLTFLAIAALVIMVAGTPEYQRCIDQHPGDEQFCEPYR